MKKLMAIQLSDIHIKSARDKNSVLTKIDKLADALRAYAEIKQAKEALLIISGDIAFSGKSEEYEIFAQFLESLRSKLTDLKLYPVLVPGNHDCDFSLDNQSRSILIKGLADHGGEIDQSIVDGCTIVQKSYRAFEVSWFPNEIEALYSSSIYKKVRLKTDNEITVIIHLVNTAWLSQNPENPGQLRFPVEYIRDEPADERADLIILVQHHPANWMEPENAKAYSKVIAHTVDLVITGHEHEPSYHGKLYSDGASVTYLEGGVLQDSKLSHNSSFNIINFDSVAAKSQLTVFEWNKKSEQYEHKKEQDNSESYMRNKRRNKRSFTVSERFAQQLEDPGASYQHPLKPALVLDDVFVCPDFREASLSAKARPETVYGKNIGKYLLANNTVLFIGAEGGGKTTLMKHIFTVLYRQDVIPVLLTGKDITNSDTESLYEAVRRAFLIQYQNSDMNSYEQLRKTQKAVLIDDYHKSPLKDQQRARAIEYLATLFEHVILCGSVESRLEELNAKSKHDIFLKMRLLEILEFGHRRRHELIHNWFQLGRGGGELSPERATLAMRAEKKINEALGRDLVPSHPLVILVLLNQIEMQAKIDMSPGSQSYLYDVLIKACLAKSSYNYVDADTRHHYLAELAYHMYQTRRFSLSSAELDEYNERHASTYDIKLNYERMIDDLVSTQILCRRMASVSFRYKYVYYYFAGHYFAANISEPTVRAEVPKMVSRLYNEDYANIVMFISYFTNDPLIIDSLLSTARRLFSRYEPCRMEQDVDSLNKFLEDALAERKRYYLSASSTAEENRLNVLEEQDANAELTEIDKSGDGIHIDEDEARLDPERQFVDEVLQMNATFKTIQILGQIIRTYIGKIKKDPKISLANECYSLGLRLLSFTNKAIECNLNDLFDQMIKYISMKREHLQAAEKAALVSRFLGGLTEANAFVIVRYVADSVGNERLANTFRSVLAANSTSAYRLIDLAIKLENSQDAQEFPMREVELLSRELTDNRLALGLLRRLVWQHFYLFEKEVAIKQKACGILDIEFKDTRLLPSETKH